MSVPTAFALITYCAVMLAFLAYLLRTHAREHNDLKWYEAVLFVTIVPLWPVFAAMVLWASIDKRRQNR